LDKAVEIKNLGNDFFQNGNFVEAVKCYSEAINLCPQNDKQELPKFYQNRAAAFENLVIIKIIISNISNNCFLNKKFNYLRKCTIK
jgi:import receptor subunit TOM70